MKKRLGFCFAMAGSLLLASCALNVYEDDFYRVDFYSDYVGIDTDYANKALDKTKAALIGHAFAKKEVTSLDSESSESTTYYGVTEPTMLDGGSAEADYRKSTREAPEGHEWVFEKWAGYYEDGTPVDLAHIAKDCSVFAIFKATPIIYNVNISGLSTEGSFYRVKYGETLMDNADYAAHPITADPVSFYADFYYQTSAFNGITYSVGGVDHTDEVDVTSNYYEWISHKTIVGDTKFVFTYDEPVKHQYNVHFCAVDEADNSHILADWTDQLVTYDQPLIKPAIAETDWTYIKSVGQYDDSAKADNPSLSVVDVDCIRHHCEVTLIYRKKSVIRHVNIYSDDGSTLKTSLESYDGVPPTLPTPEVSAGRSFTGTWVKRGTMEVYDPSLPVTGDVDLVPISTQTEVSKDATIVDQSTGLDVTCTFTYRYDRKRQGYMLSSFGKHATATDATFYHLASADFDYSNNANYASIAVNYVGIESFGGSASGSLIYEIALPVSTKYIMARSFAGLNNVSAIDLRSNTSLTEIGDMAFERLSMLGDLYLPASLQDVGERIVNECKYLEDGHLHINLTAAQVEERNFGERWNYSSATHPVAVDYLP